MSEPARPPRSSISLPTLLVAAGVATPQALASGALVPVDGNPASLLGPDETISTARRWSWEVAETAAFCAWVERVLADRFSQALQIRDAAGAPPTAATDLLRLRLGSREERCDWEHVNRDRWIGAFCTILNRLLDPVGLVALEFDTGWFDAIICFCRAPFADQLAEYFPLAD